MKVKREQLDLHWIVIFLSLKSSSMVTAISSSSSSSVPEVVRQDGERAVKFVRLASFNDVIFQNHVLFLSPRRSRIRCALDCELDPACMAFTLTLNECRGHCSRLSTGGLSSSIEIGALSFERPARSPKVTEFNLAAGTASSLPIGMAYYTTMTSPNSTCSCESEPVVEMIFDPGSRSGALITLTSKDTDYITFYLGEVAGDGFGSGRRNCSTEMHSDYGYFKTFTSPNNTPTYYPNYVNSGAHNVITLNITAGYVSIYNGVTQVILLDNNAFCVDNTDNNNVYLGLNRVAKFGSYVPRRSGVGLCRASVQFYP